MGKTYDPELQRQLEEYIAEVGNQRVAAGNIGYSEGAISTYRSRTYKGRVENVEDKLREFFKLRSSAAQLAISMPDYVPTSISSQVYDTIRICHLKGGLAIECGDAGIGKTKAAQKYAADYPNSTILITVNPCFTSLSSFLKLLCRRLRIPTGRKDDMWLEIDNTLRGGRKVLIIDEAQHLPIKTIDSIRSFFDSNPELGICFVGNAETVAGGNGKARESYSQIRNRTKLTEIRHTTHITRNDIQLLFPELAKQDKEIDFLHVVAQSEQGVRGAVNLYSNAYDNENTSYDGLLAMAKTMRIVQF